MKVGIFVWVTCTCHQVVTSSDNLDSLTSVYLRSGYLGQTADPVAQSQGEIWANLIIATDIIHSYVRYSYIIIF